MIIAVWFLLSYVYVQVNQLIFLHYNCAHVYVNISWLELYRDMLVMHCVCTFRWYPPSLILLRTWLRVNAVLSLIPMVYCGVDTTFGLVSSDLGYWR